MHRQNDLRWTAGQHEYRRHGCPYLNTGNATAALASSFWATAHWRQTLPPPWKRLRWCGVRRAR
jgi:hypothetical protein